MQKVSLHNQPITQTHRLVSFIKENYRMYMKNHAFEVQPQMPKKQLIHFMKQAVRKEACITIQLNPLNHEDLKEVTGKAVFSPHSSQVILTENESNAVYLIHPKQMRHIRLAK